MWNGFSSHQLVLWKNPNLPNIITETLPALQGVTTSEILKHHLDAMHSARKAFIKCEQVKKFAEHCVIQLEQQKKHLTQETVYSIRKKGKNRWLGPAKVIFQDGRAVFVRHGGVYIRVSTNRLGKGCM